MASIGRSVRPSLFVRSKQVTCHPEAAPTLVFDVACEVVMLLIDNTLLAMGKVVGAVDDEIVSASVADQLVAFR